MYSHERSLVKEYEGRPFVLLGVNSDDPESLAEIEKVRELTWRSFINEQGDEMISDQWQINGWPTLVLIDDRGVIRGRGFQASQVDLGVDALVREAEARQSASHSAGN